MAQEWKTHAVVRSGSSHAHGRWTKATIMKPSQLRKEQYRYDTDSFHP